MSTKETNRVNPIAIGLYSLEITLLLSNALTVSTSVSQIDIKKSFAHMFHSISFRDNFTGY